MKIAFPRRLLQLQEVTLPLCEIGPSGIMLSQVRKEYEKQRSIGKSVREAIREVEKILGIKDVQTDAAGKSVVYFKEDYEDDILSKFIGMKIDRCPTCRQLLAHRGGQALPCHNPKCPANPRTVGEAYKSLSMVSGWTVDHPGYEFRIVARKPEGRKEIQKHNSLPRARVAAKLHAKQTGETVEVYDHQGRKYYTFSGLHEGYGRTPLEDALVKSFEDAGVRVNHLYELGNEIASIDSLKFEIASSKRLYGGKTVPGSEVPVKLRSTGKTIYLPFDQAQELAKLWNRDMRSLKKYVNSRW